MKPQEQSVCVRCARSMRKGCCWLDPKVADEKACGITLADVERICKATGKAPSEFVVVEKVTPEIRKALSFDGFDDLGRVMKGNLRIRMASDQHGYCKLLGPQGCTLSKSTRPRICALYPSFYQQVGGHILVKGVALTGATECLAIHEAACGGDEAEQRLFRIMRVREPELEAIAVKAAAEADAHAALSKAEIKQRLRQLGKRVSS